jgi:Flp pilus assembly protein CpaB
LARLPSAGRTVAIVVAIILAGVAVFAITRYVGGIEDRAFQDAELVEVFVAKGVIPAGTRAETAISQGLIERDQMPRVNRPSGAITALEQIAGLAAIDRILPGDVVVQARFGDPATAAAQFEIPDGLQAISVEVGIPPGVAGYIKPDDNISVIAHIDVPEPAAPVIGPDGTLVQPEAADGPTETRSQFLVQDVQVLAVGRRVVVTNEQGQTQDQVQQTESVLVTIAVTSDQAERLVFALNEGSLYMTLLPEGFEPEDTTGRTFDDLFLP